MREKKKPKKQLDLSVPQVVSTNSALPVDLLQKQQLCARREVRIHFLPDAGRYKDSIDPGSDLAGELLAALQNLRQDYPRGHWRWDGRLWKKFANTKFDGELRIDIGSVHYRFYFFIDDEVDGVAWFVFTNAFEKGPKSEKREIRAGNERCKRWRINPKYPST